MSHDEQSLNQALDSLLNVGEENTCSGDNGAAQLESDVTELCMEFSVIFFSDSSNTPGNKYKLVFDVTKFADENEFSAVWLPERHFHSFGGIYPNPATLAAALAVQTKNIRFRSGSVVLPLHHPTEVVESWSIVDNLSNGRVDLGFASGWNPNDFVSIPENYKKRKQIWHERIPLVQRLWRGEEVEFYNGNNEKIFLKTYPEPIQKELNVWLVVTKSDEGFEHAGMMGYNVLTMLQGIDLVELGRKINIYRRARQEHGFDPLSGKVTLMLHTLVHDNLELVESAVKKPFSSYIKNALSGHIQAMDKKPSEEEIEKIVNYSYRHYFTTGALFGAVEDALKVVKEALQTGVDEIACLMDFGVEHSLVLESLPYLNTLREEAKTLQVRRKDFQKNIPSDVSSEVKKMAKLEKQEAVAIVGIHGFLPQAMDIEEFFDYLDKDKSAITEISDDRFDWRDFYDPTGIKPESICTKVGGFIPDIKGFDPEFFRIFPEEAALIDPQQRLLLMSVYKTIEDAGYTPEELKGKRIGVYVAIEDNEYLHYLQKNNMCLGENILNHHPSMAANRISYFFDFRGPSQIVNTMCSSAAVAIHDATVAIKNAEIDAAIVAGARIILNPEPYMALSRMNVLSSSDYVKSFSPDADGYIRSEGVASIMLKPVEVAVKDSDTVYAVIKGSAVNYNGRGGMSIAAPNKESHASLIKTCYRNAGVDVRDIEYIEAQGMGNQVADIAEWDAINNALEQLAEEQNVPYKPGGCRVSTLKPILGHMECVSAFGALFKIIRSIQTNKIHKIVNFSEPNSFLNIKDKPCRLLDKTEDWEKTNSPRLSGLHSYGSGGANAHLLIEEFVGLTNDSKKIEKTKHNFNVTPCWAQKKEEKKKSYENTMRKNEKRICVVGAGPSGLVMAKSLLEEGHRPVVFEKQLALGGLWVLNKEKKAGAYKKTRFQSSKYTSVFSDFYLDDIGSNFYTVQDVKRYLDAYAENFQVLQHIEYACEVTSIREVGKKWEVTIKRAEEEFVEKFDGVALCQGSFWQPNIPKLNGFEKFSGKSMHSGEYFDSKPFINKKVLVVGNGVSAMDIAEELSDVADTVLWSRRSNKLILPRMVGFVPNDCQSAASLLIEANRSSIIERLALSMPAYYKIYKESGILPSKEEFRKNPIVHINDGIIQLVADNKVHVRGPIETFTGKGCVFSEAPDKEDEVDVVIFCTGYQNFGPEDKRYEFIPDINVASDFSMGIFYEKNPSLVNTSVLPIAFTGSFYFLEMIARWYVQMLSGKYRLTEEEAKSRIGLDDYLIMGPVSNVLFSLRLGLFPRPEKEFKEFWRLLNYPAFPMIQRLRGFHHNTKSVAKLDEFVKKSYVKTTENDSSLRQLKHRILAGLPDNSLKDLLGKGDIDESDFLGSRKYLSSPVKLTWESQYIKNISEQEGESLDFVLPRDHVLSGLRVIVADILNIQGSKVNDERNLSEYGFDSISLTTLSTRIIETYPFISLEPSVFLECSNILELSGFLYEKYKDDFQLSRKKSLNGGGGHNTITYFSAERVILQRGSKGISPIFWFHAALGTVQVYQPLVSKLDAKLPFYAIQARGIIDGLEPLNNLSDMAASYSQILLDTHPSGVFNLGGYSQGGVLAHEIARQLQVMGREVRQIVMVDTPFPPTLTFLSEKHKHLLTFINLLQMYGKKDSGNLFMHDVGNSVKDYIQYFAELGLKKGLPFSLDSLSELLGRHYRVFNANIIAMQNYSLQMLPFPNDVACHYFKRKLSKCFFNELFLGVKEFKQQNNYYENSNCSKRWSVIYPDFHLHKTLAADHFSFFEDNEVLNKMANLCNKGYAGHAKSDTVTEIS